MYIYVFLSALLYCVLGEDHSTYGKNSTINDFPYQAAIYRVSPRYKGFSGGAVIVSSKYLLTAAHCVGGRKDEYSVLIGESYIPNHYDSNFLYGKTYKVSKITIHPEYDSSFYPTNADNDIAVLTVESSLKLNGITSAAIELSLLRTHAGIIAEVSGYGNISRIIDHRPKTVAVKEFYRHLKSSPVPTIARESCVKYFSDYDSFYHITDNMLCAGRPCENDACEVNGPPNFTSEGNSGGPLIADNKLIGIVSFGWSCANYDPGVYTYVFKQKDFISNATDGLLGSRKGLHARKNKTVKIETTPVSTEISSPPPTKKVFYV